MFPKGIIFYILDLGKKEVGEKAGGAALKDRRGTILTPSRIHRDNSCESGGLWYLMNPA